MGIICDHLRVIGTIWELFGIIWYPLGIVWDHLEILLDHLGINRNHLGDTWCHLVVIPVDSDSQSKFLSNSGSQSVSQWVSEIAKSRARPLWNRVGYKNTNLLSPPWVTKMLIHYLWGSKRAIWNIIIKNCRVELKILPVHPDAPSSSIYGGNPSITPLVWGPHHIPPVVKGFPSSSSWLFPMSIAWLASTVSSS